MAHLSEIRLQAYLQLIQSLLTCPCGQADKFLQAHQELIDAGLVQVMRQIAQTLANEGKAETATFLTTIAQQLAQALGLNLTEPSEAQERLLLLIFQTITEHDANPQIIYPLLQANIEQLDGRLAILLQRFAQTMFQQADEAVKPHIADILNKFGRLIGEFPSGSRADNIEISITAYQLALTIYTRKAFPQEWAILQKDLGNAYQEQIHNKKRLQSIAVNS